MPGPHRFGRVVGLALALLVLAVTAWGCLVAGVVLILSDYLGAGPAFLGVAGALSGVVLLIAHGFRTQPTAARTERVEGRVLSAMLPLLLGVLARPALIRAGLVVAAGLVLVSAIVFPGHPRRDDSKGTK